MNDSARRHLLLYLPIDNRNNQHTSSRSLSQKSSPRPSRNQNTIEPTRQKRKIESARDPPPADHHALPEVVRHSTATTLRQTRVTSSDYHSHFPSPSKPSITSLLPQFKIASFCKNVLGVVVVRNGDVDGLTLRRCFPCRGSLVSDVVFCGYRRYYLVTTVKRLQYRYWYDG